MPIYFAKMLEKDIDELYIAIYWIKDTSNFIGYDSFIGILHKCFLESTTLKYIIKIDFL